MPPMRTREQRIARMLKTAWQGSLQGELLNAEPFDDEGDGIDGGGIDVAGGDTDGGADDKWTFDRYVIVTPGAQNFTLSYIPVGESVFLTVNGVDQDENTDYTVNWTTGVITFSSTDLVATDVVVCRYQTRGDATSAVQGTSAATTPSSAVDGAGWTRNSCASSGSGEVTLINNVNADTASVVSNDIFTDLDGLTLKFDVVATGNADWLDFGILDAALPATTMGTDGMSAVVGFYGARLDIWNAKVGRSDNGNLGTAGTVVTYDPETPTYEKWVLTFEDAGATITMKLYRADGATLIATWSVSKPSFDTFRLAIGANSGGFSGVFKVRNTPELIWP